MRTTAMTALKLSRFKTKAANYSHIDLLDAYRFAAGSINKSDDSTSMQASMEKLFVLRDELLARMNAADTNADNENTVSTTAATASSDSKKSTADTDSTADSDTEAVILKEKNGSETKSGTNTPASATKATDSNTKAATKESATKTPAKPAAKAA